jgi:hypothetical protein
MVLQHVPVRRGMALIEHLLGRVATGGIAALHLCTARLDSPGSRARYWAQRHVPGANRLLNLARGRPAREPLMQMNAYPLDHVLPLAASLDFDLGPIRTHEVDRFRWAELLLRRR